MADNNAPRNNSAPKGKRMVTLTLSLPTFISSVLALLLGIIWVFILGVIIGRGQIAENDKTGLNTVVAANKAQGARGASEAPAERAGQNAPAAPSGVIAPEDLQYRDNLRSAPSQPKRSDPPKPAAKPETPKPDAPKPEPARAEQPKPAAPTAQTAPAPAAALSPAASDSGKEIFDYVYQVAAFREEGQAAKMRDALQRAGIKAGVEKESQNGSVWFKVITPFRGSPEDTRVLKEALNKSGIDKVILKSKSPVR